MELVKKVSGQKVLRKAQISLAFFDVGNCDDEYKHGEPLGYITPKMLRKLVVSSRFSELRKFKQIPYFHSISWIQKSWQNYTYS